MKTSELIECLRLYASNIEIDDNYFVSVDVLRQAADKLEEYKEIIISKKDAELIANFIEYNLFEVIRNDTDIDNFDWLVGMCDLYKRMKEAIEVTQNDN